jgi:hypothetical protein
VKRLTPQQQFIERQFAALREVLAKLAAAMERGPPR